MDLGISNEKDCIYPPINMDRPVLLLDDNEIQLMTRRTILRQAGYSVLATTQAEKALAIVRDKEQGKTLKLVVTDHLMPEMRGDEFVREVRETLPDVTILVMTGHPQVEAEYEGLNVEFLLKPCTPECLLEYAARAYSSPLRKTA